MKQQQCWYACDEEGCDEVSPPEVNFAKARSVAFREGWRFYGGVYPEQKCRRHV